MDRISRNAEGGTMNDEVKDKLLQFIVQRSAFIVSAHPVYPVKFCLESEAARGVRSQ